MTYQNLWEVAKSKLTEKFIALHVDSRKKCQINELFFHLKKQAQVEQEGGGGEDEGWGVEEEQIKFKVSRNKEIIKNRNKKSTWAQVSHKKLLENEAIFTK